MINAKLITGEEVIVVEWVRGYCVSAINSAGELFSCDMSEIHLPITNKTFAVSENFPAEYRKTARGAAKNIKYYVRLNKTRYRVNGTGVEGRSFRHLRKACSYLNANLLTDKIPRLIIYFDGKVRSLSINGKISHADDAPVSKKTLRKLLNPSSSNAKMFKRRKNASNNNPR